MAGGDRIIADADILIDGDRIAAIGPRGIIAVPADTPVRDLGGRTVLPGFIDAHDHIGSLRRNVIGYEAWGLRSRLAFAIGRATVRTHVPNAPIVCRLLID